MRQNTDAARLEGVRLSATDARLVAGLLVIALEGAEDEAERADRESGDLDVYEVDGAAVTPQEYAGTLRGDVARGRAVLRGIRAQLSAGAGE